MELPGTPENVLIGVRVCVWVDRKFQCGIVFLKLKKEVVAGSGQWDYWVTEWPAIEDLVLGRISNTQSCNWTQEGGG